MQSQNQSSISKQTLWSLQAGSALNTLIQTNWNWSRLIISELDLEVHETFSRSSGRPYGWGDCRHEWLQMDTDGLVIEHHLQFLLRLSNREPITPNSRLSSSSICGRRTEWGWRPEKQPCRQKMERGKWKSIAMPNGPCLRTSEVPSHKWLSAYIKAGTQQHVWVQSLN